MRLSQSLENYKSGNFTFSGAKINDSLGAAEYTLVSIAIDTSSSVYGFKQELEDMVSAIVDGCGKSPRAGQLMVRLLEFNNASSEIHGFKELRNINKSDYSGVLNPSGMTALYDAFGNSVEAVESYGKALTDQDYQANSIVFIVTDGAENSSKSYRSPNEIKKLINRVRKSECVESISVILIGLGTGSTSPYLQKLKNDADIDEYIDVGDVTPQKLAKLAKFVSHSVSSTSQALGSGSSAPISSVSF